MGESYVNEKYNSGETGGNNTAEAANSIRQCGA